MVNWLMTPILFVLVGVLLTRAYMLPEDPSTWIFRIPIAVLILISASIHYYMQPDE